MNIRVFIYSKNDDFVIFVYFYNKTRIKRNIKQNDRTKSQLSHFDQFTRSSSTISDELGSTTTGEPGLTPTSELGLK